MGQRLSKRLSSSQVEAVVPVEGEPSDLRASASAAGAANEKADANEDAQRTAAAEQVEPGADSDHASAAEESIYLQSVLRDNAFIRDGLSGEQLDIRGQCVSVGPDTRTITKESLEAFFQKHAPESVSEADDILAEWSVGEIIKRMKAKFGEAPAITSMAAEDTRLITKESLEAFVRKHKLNYKVDWLLAKSVDELIQFCKERFGEAPEIASTAKEAVEYVQSKLSLGPGEPVLLTGPAACGKSTFTKQCMYRTATAGTDAGAGRVPVLVPVIELAKTMQEQNLKNAGADILKAHLESKHAADASFLLQMRTDHRLLVLLDGMDEAGNCRETLEQYVSTRLATEVQLCVTGREQGIEAMELFSSFVHVQVQPLSEKQQAKMIHSRMEGRKLEGASVEERTAGFTKQLRGNVSFAELAKNPLLLNLLVSEYMQHERVGGNNGNIYFEGRCVFGQKEYVGSFPGVHKREWDRVTQVLKDRSVACVFIPEENDMYGEHVEDPQQPSLCFCESFLYHDAPEKVQRVNLEFIMDEANVHVGETLPEVGKKIEVRVKVPKWNKEKWWVCTVKEVETGRIFVSFDGLGRALKPAWVLIDKINQTGQRRTAQRAKQAPFGCRWYAEWTKKVAECEADKQQAVVVYKKGKRGIKTFEGLGASQLKEVEYLETHFYPKKDYIEVDATEFEAQNTMNRAQVYKSAIEGMLKQQGDKRDADDGSNANVLLELLLPFMHELAFRLHTQEGNQFRSFDRTFIQNALFGTETAQAQKFKAIWTTRLLPAVRASQFPLLVWEPEGTNDIFRISHLSFQEYLCASRLVKHLLRDGASECAAFVQSTGLQKIEALLGSDRYQVIVQMGRELLANDEALAETFANSFLPKSKEATIRVESNLNTATAAITLLSLVSCQSDAGIKLQLAKSGLNADAIGGWHSCLQQWDRPCKIVTAIDISDNDLGNTGDAAKALLAGVLELHAGPISSLNISGCKIGVAGAKYIAAVVPKCKALVTVTFGDKQAVTMTTTMAEADFRGKLDSYEAQIVAAFLPKCQALVKFDISNNGLHAAGGDALAEALKGNKIMQELNIANNRLGRQREGYATVDLSGVIKLADTIPTMGALETITFGDKQAATMKIIMTEADLSGKELGASGAIIVAAFLPKCQALTSLDISANAMATKEAGKALADALMANSVLKELNVANNLDGLVSWQTKTDGPAFAQELANGVSANGALASLDLSQNSVPESEANQIKAACALKGISLKI